MISIVAAYYNRKLLFRRTLDSIKSQIDKSKIDVEFIVIDDGSDDDERLEDLVTTYPFLKIIRLEKENKWYKNSCIPFNIGFQHVSGDQIIIQNPECLHFGNILEYTKKNLTEENYLSFGCYSLGEHSTDNLDEIIKDRNNILKIIAENNEENKKEGTDCWYNHSTIRPVGFHFCVALTKKNLYELGGFDERFATGVAYDDNEFLHRVKLKGLDVKIIDQEIVLHQNHYRKPSAMNNAHIMDAEQKKVWFQLFERNRLLFENVTLFNTCWKVNHLVPIVEKKENIADKLLGGIKNIFKK